MLSGVPDLAVANGSSGFEAVWPTASEDTADLHRIVGRPEREASENRSIRKTGTFENESI